MLFRPQQLTAEFKDFKSGNIDALAFILNSERERVFDYLMRLTGQLVKSADIAEEALASIEQVADDSDTLQELLIAIYKTSRNFASDVWNAETPKLENSAYQGNQGKDSQAMITLESLVRNLPGLQREVILLRDRYGFALDEVAEIMGRPTSDIEMVFAQALSSLETGSPELSSRISELMPRLLVFARPKGEGPATQNLSLLMNDYRKTDRMSPSRGRWIRLGIYAVILAVCWVYRVELRQYIESDLWIKVQAWLGQSKS